MWARSKGEALQVSEVTEQPHVRTLYTLQRSEQFTAGVESIAASCSVPAHKHDDTEEILFCTGGCGMVKLETDAGEERLDFTPGVMVLVPKGRTHSIHNTSDTEELWLSFTLKGEQASESFMAKTPSSS